MTHKKHIKQNNKPASQGGCLKSSHLTQFFLFFFLFLASASMLEPTLEWLVALLMLLTLSEECCLLMRRSGGWFCCCCWLPLLPAEEGMRQESQHWVFVLQISQSSACLQCVCTRLVSFRHQFGRVDDPIDGGLGHSVLLLQQLDGLPEVIQLRVLQRDEGQSSDASLVFKKKKKKLLSPSALLSAWDSSVLWSCCPDSVQTPPPGEPVRETWRNNFKNLGF